MNIINKIYYIICFLSLTSCCKIHFLYQEKSLSNENEGITKALYDNYDLRKDEKSLIVFESNFNNIVKVINGNEIIFNRSIKTKQTLGFAAPCVIDNSNDILIFIDDDKKIMLKSENINKYKFIYINKQRNKYSITLTNEAHGYQ